MDSWERYIYLHEYVEIYDTKTMGNSVMLSFFSTQVMLVDLAAGLAW